jgi:hypothetical protein
MFRIMLRAALVIFAGHPALVLASGDGTFQAPFSISTAGRPGPVTIHTGDVNQDGKLELLNANGSSSILVLFQNAQNRQDWKSIALPVGLSTFFVRAGDFDADGFDDIVAADTSSTAFYVHSKGNNTFDAPKRILGSNGSRWVTIGDWNEDGHLDVATANLNSANETIYFGDGTGNFTLSQNITGSREHTLEAGDFDGDGYTDLLLGTGIPGITPFKNLGNGKFQQKTNVSNLGCVEYITVGDFNADGKADVAPTCIDFQNAFVGISMGTGAYRNAMEVKTVGTGSSAIADLNGDGHQDFALTSQQNTTLLIFPGKGDGTFVKPAFSFGPTGYVPVFLIAEDLDADGRPDVISADQQSSSMTVFWGVQGDRFLESGYEVKGFTSARSMAMGDLDKDGVPDLFFPRSSTNPARIFVFLKPGQAALTAPSLVIDTANFYTYLDVVDLDGDGNLDLAGAYEANGLALVALLDADGMVKTQTALSAGLLPKGITVGRIDGDSGLDLALPLSGANAIAIFLNKGAGTFNEVITVPTIDKPKKVLLKDLDGDGKTDLEVLSSTAVGIHYGGDGGTFLEPVKLIEDLLRNYTDIHVADLNGDRIPEILVSEQKSTSVYVYTGMGGRQFSEPKALKTSNYPVSIAVADLNGDDLPDITTANYANRTLSVLLNKGVDGFPTHSAYGIGFPPTGHRVADLNRDGAMDLVGFYSAAAIVLLGHPKATDTHHFLRGDTSGDGLLELTDPILLINRLFLGGELLRCEDAADADDDGELALTDAVLVIDRLFLGGPPLPAPYPTCGDDTVADTLKDCSTNC